MLCGFLGRYGKDSQAYEYGTKGKLIKDRGKNIEKRLKKPDRMFWERYAET